MPTVEISDAGRAGSITYREDPHALRFEWEFALSPALVIIIGPTTSEWEGLGDWATGRQEEIFEHVAGEVIRQKTSGHSADIDLAAGTITILEGRRRGGSPIRRRDAVDALAQIDHPKAHAAVDEASRHHLSVDVRLAAAEALQARGALDDLEPVLIRELKVLDRRADGLDRALRLAAAHPTPAVKQALLWASWNHTECAADCAKLLLTLMAGPEAVPPLADVLAGLGFHTSYFQRKAAFDALCRKIRMTLDPE